MLTPLFVSMNAIINDVDNQRWLSKKRYSAYNRSQL